MPFPSHLKWCETHSVNHMAADCPTKEENMTRVFIAGPMTGYPNFNYEAFDDAADRLKGRCDVINPAENYQRRQDLPRTTYIRRTIQQLSAMGNKVDTVVVLPGWERSQGAALEVDVALQLGLSVVPLECILDPHWDDETCNITKLSSNRLWGNKCTQGGTRWAADQQNEFEAVGPSCGCTLDGDTCDESLAEAAERLRDTPGKTYAVCPAEEAAPLVSVRASILDEAKRLITGDRNNQYGPPGKDFNRTANVLTSLGYGVEGGDGKIEVLDDHDVAVIMIALKLSRIMWTPEKRDSWVDVAGYAGCGAEVAGAE